MSTEQTKEEFGIHWPITIFSVGLVLAVVFVIAVYPDAAMKMVSGATKATMSATGPFLMMLNISLLIFCFWLCCTKYGNIVLGEGAPQYSMFSYIAMMACATLASASMFWSFTEWAYGTVGPGLDMVPGSKEAMEMSMGYVFWHWGFNPNSQHAVVGLVTAYAVYVRKLPTSSMSGIAENMMGNFPLKTVLGRMIDVIVIFCTLAGLGVSLGLGIPVIAGGLNRLFGMEVNFPLQIGIVVVLGIIFSWSSFVGTGRGMRFLSDNSVKVLAVLLVWIFFMGPTEFIQKLFVSTLGMMTEYLPRMMTFTDPIKNSGFAEDWTIFFFAFALSYAALMGIFIAKISRGRTIRTLVMGCVFGISAGTWVFFSVNGGLAIHREVNGIYSMIDVIQNGDPYRGVFTLLDTVPLGTISALIYIICVAGFITTTLDAASLALASTTTKKLDSDQNPGNMLRLFWCGMLTVVPLAILFSGAPFSALKNLAILVSVPLGMLMVFLTIGLVRWMLEDRKIPNRLILSSDGFAQARSQEETAKEVWQ